MSCKDAFIHPKILCLISVLLLTRIFIVPLLNCLLVNTPRPFLALWTERFDVFGNFIVLPALRFSKCAVLLCFARTYFEQQAD